MLWLAKKSFIKGIIALIGMIAVMNPAAAAAKELYDWIKMIQCVDNMTDFKYWAVQILKLLTKLVIKIAGGGAILCAI